MFACEFYRIRCIRAEKSTTHIVTRNEQIPLQREDKPKLFISNWMNVASVGT